MDEPGWSWPAWKFGMRREDLATTLHDQYNTFPSPIQDPQAFHHDVSDISHKAQTVDEFHRLMAERKDQRLAELNDMLESAAFEIIAHPKLIGTDQWQFALQLFRTRSLDSLVRYFASYLPDSYHRFRHDFPRPSSSTCSTASSFADTSSVKTTSTDQTGFDDVPAMILSDGDAPVVLTAEPESMHPYLSMTAKYQGSSSSSARSVTMKSDTSAPSPASEMDSGFAAMRHTTPPSRSMSFSGSENEAGPTYSSESRHGLHHVLSARLHDDDDDNSSQSAESDVQSTSGISIPESRSSYDSVGMYEEVDDVVPKEQVTPVTVEVRDEDDGDDCLPTAQLPEDDLYGDAFPTAQYPLDSFSFDAEESSTPTPKPQEPRSSYIDTKSIYSSRKYSSIRSSSPTAPLSRLLREVSPTQGSIRRSPAEVLSRVQKSMPDPCRLRGKGRRLGTPNC